MVAATVRQMLQGALAFPPHGSRFSSKRQPCERRRSFLGPWQRERSPGWEYLEVLCVIAVVTAAAWLVPLPYHTLGLVYLLGVIVLSLRVGRGPVLAAAVVSAATWVYFFVPPRLSFALTESSDGLLLGTYVVVALVAGQLTTRLRAAEREVTQRERRSTALFQLTRALAEAKTLAEAVESALRQADGLFPARTALLLADASAPLHPHAAGSFALDKNETAVAQWVWSERREAGRFTDVMATAEALHVPLLRMGQALGVFVVRPPDSCAELTSSQRDLIHGFAGQIALLLEREQLRAASDRQKFFAESDRLHRTLLDSVSHELKTPLSVLRSAAGKLNTDDVLKRAVLTREISLATQRLDHLVANLLDQTRLDAGGLRPQLDWCDVRDMVHVARRGLGEALAGRPFKTDIPADMPLFMADAPLMEHVLANILLNATLHTPAGTAIEVTAGVESREKGTWVFLRVDDRGAGLPVELRETLFQKFRRGNAARAGGLGLGLSIVRGFMLAQGGEVVAGSNPAGGARFTVYLPEVVHGGVPNDEN